jgi:mycothiol synthase
VLRDYKPEDLPGLTELLSKSFEEMQWNEETVSQRLVEAADVKKIYIIDCDGKPVATASARIMPDEYPNAGYLHWVAVHPDYRKKKLGTAVSLAVLREFVAMGCKSAVLETEDKRLAAIKVYQDLGFKAVHRHSSHALRWAMIAELLASAGL